MVEAELILTGAPVLTQDPRTPETDAVAFRHGRVLDAGSHAEIQALEGPGTRVLELASDRVVIPGFVDAHTHAARLGEMHWRQDLGNADSKSEALQVLEAIAERTPEDGWVIGWNWDESTWPSKEPLTREDLDEASTTRKIMARRVCGHQAAVNTPALEALDLDEAPGVVTDNGAPTGTLTEDAAETAWEACAPAFETSVKGLRQETQRLARLGITTVADTAGPRDINLLTRGAREGFFHQRSHLYVRERLLEHMETLSLGPLLGPRCSLLGVKTYTDGSIGARTAATSEPYEDEDTRGELLRDAKHIEALAARLRTLGLQLKAHAIGDRAIQAVLDGIKAAGLTATDRPRIEHAELLTPAHIEHAEQSGAVFVMQPNFVANWQTPGGLYEQALGPERARSMNPLRSVHDSEAVLAFGSDGMPYGPLYGLEAATDHPNKAQRLTEEQALEAYTRGAAYALGREDELGCLTPGALADAVVLSRDPREVGFDAVDVQATIRGGEVLYEAPARA